MAGIARTFFVNPIPTIDAASSGYALLKGIQIIHALEGWLVPLKFFAISTELLAITMGLATIIFIQSAQTNILGRVLKSAKS